MSLREAEMRRGTDEWRETDETTVRQMDGNPTQTCFLSACSVQ